MDKLEEGNEDDAEIVEEDEDGKDEQQQQLNKSSRSGAAAAAAEEKPRSLLLSPLTFESLAVDALVHAQSLAFQLDDKALVRDTSHELIELVGKLDTACSAHLVALYQSSAQALELERVARKSCSVDADSLLAGYFHALDEQRARHVRHNALNSPVVRQLLDLTRAKFNSLRHTSLSANHFALVKDLPANYLLLVMQHNVSGSELYTAVFDRSRASPLYGAATAAAGGGGSGALGKASMAKGGQLLQQQLMQQAASGGVRSHVAKMKSDRTQLVVLQVRLLASLFFE